MPLDHETVKFVVELAEVHRPGEVPVPVSATVCCDPETLLELSVKVSVPFCAPRAFGVKVTVTVQD